MDMFELALNESTRIRPMDMSASDAIGYVLAPHLHRLGLGWLEATNMARRAYHAPQPARIR